VVRWGRHGCCTSLQYRSGLPPLAEDCHARFAGTRPGILVSCWMKGSIASERIAMGAPWSVVGHSLYAATVTVIAWGATFSSGMGSPESRRSSR
jgi:hypothetical protein